MFFDINADVVNIDLVEVKMINLNALKKLKEKHAVDINNFAKEICEVQPMPDNLVSDILKALDGKSLVLSKREDNDQA